MASRRNWWADGSRIYFSSITAYNYLLMRRQRRAGIQSPSKGPLHNAILTILNDISPDRSERLVGSCAVLYQDNCPLWVLPVLGRSPRRLGTLSASFSAGAATWSPDGKEIVYAPGNSLYRAKIDDKSRERSRAQPQAKLFTGLAGHLTGAVCVSALHRNSCRR